MIEPFTKENAAEKGRKGGLTTHKRWLEKKQAMSTLLAGIPLETQLAARQNKVAEQVDISDRLINSCKDPEMFVKLVNAKATLWNLVFPKAGVNRPSKSKRSSSMPVEPVNPV